VEAVRICDWGYIRSLLTPSRADQEFGKLLEILENSDEIVVIENAEEWEDDEKPPTITPGEIFRIPGSIVSFVERLDDELTRSLQHIDPHTSEYIERLTDEALLYAQLVRTLVYVESMKKNPSLELPQEPLNRIVMRRLEHVYFKVRQYSAISYLLMLTFTALTSYHYPREQRLEGNPREP
jgi:translation initiation factor 3 subunit C